MLWAELGICLYQFLIIALFNSYCSSTVTVKVSLSSTVSAYYDLICPYMEMKIEVVWSHFKVFWLNKDDSTRQSDRKKKKEVDRRGGKTILKCGKEWTLPGLLGQLKTELGGKWLL